MLSSIPHNLARPLRVLTSHLNLHATQSIRPQRICINDVFIGNQTRYAFRLKSGAQNMRLNRSSERSYDKEIVCHFGHSTYVLARHSKSITSTQLPSIAGGSFRYHPAIAHPDVGMVPRPTAHRELPTRLPKTSPCHHGLMEKRRKKSTCGSATCTALEDG